MKTHPANLKPRAAQLYAMNLQPPVPRPELAAGDVDPPRCVKTQLRRRVGRQSSKAHCTLHSLLYNFVYKILFEKAK